MPPLLSEAYAYIQSMEVVVADEHTAAYATAGGEQEGIHCSQYPDEFCFFCSFEFNTDAPKTEKDLYGSLTDMVEHMAAMKREPAAIAAHVHEAYNHTVRHVIPGEPDWTKASILRHILHNGQFEQVFDTSVANMLNAIIMRQNEGLVDSSGAIVEENRKAFCDTVATLIKWKASLAKRK